MNSVPYVRGSDTSEQAAESVRLSSLTDEAKVLTLIREHPMGLTDDAIELHLGLRHQNASARRKGLVDKGKVKDSGHRRRTRSGRFAVVWVAGYDPDPIRGAKAARGMPRPSTSSLRSAVESIEAMGLMAPAMRTGALDEVVRWLRDVVAREGGAP